MGVIMKIINNCGSFFFFIIKMYNIYYVELNFYFKMIFKNVICCVNYDLKIWILIVDCICFEGNEI